MSDFALGHYSAPAEIGEEGVSLMDEFLKHVENTVIDKFESS